MDCNAVSPQELAQMQHLPLEAKIIKTKQRIKEFYQMTDGRIYVAFSGGKDSTVLLHIVRDLFPNAPAVFADTGVEFPEIRRFALSFPNVVAVKPRKRFFDIIRDCGYPIISKAVSCDVFYARKCGEGIKKFNYFRYMSPKYKRHSVYHWQCALDTPFLISDKCCSYVKKLPMRDFEKESGLFPIVGTMASEGGLREQNYLNFGCNVFSKVCTKSRPISFWTDNDVWEYIRRYNLPVCDLYYRGFSRTGCMFCGFGIFVDLNSRLCMRDTHSKAFDYFWNGGEFNSRGLWVPNAHGLGFGYVYRYLRRRREDWHAISRGKSVNRQVDFDLPHYEPWTKQCKTDEELLELCKNWGERYQVLGGGSVSL